MDIEFHDQSTRAWDSHHWLQRTFTDDQQTQLLELMNVDVFPFAREVIDKDYFQL